jgi:cytochrome c biogenesis protein CcmG, thiol:disulfide interchange protein DsbE
MLRARFLIPLAVFLVMVVFLGVGLKLDPREVPSPLIDKPAPPFVLPQLHAADKTFSQKDMLGKVWMLNVFASWCVACREEHPHLMELARTGVVPIYGLNYKDERADGIAWLARFGNPYRVAAYDRAGQVGIDYGVYGVPETYVIDKAGVIRYKRIGIVDQKIIDEKILPLVKELNGNG